MINYCSLLIVQYSLFFARMAELVDALVSGTSIRKDVQVRVLFRAQGRLRGLLFFEQDEKHILRAAVY